MNGSGQGCGQLYALYVAARASDVDAVRDRWAAIEPLVADLDESAAARVDESLAAGDTEAVRDAVAGLLFVEAESPTLDGFLATILGTVLYWFGYVAAFVLFFRARSRDEVVRRLRRAYRTVGVDIRDTETDGGTARTVFRCPYRNVDAPRFGQRTVCHDVLDRVDDGYVTFLDRHRGLDYDRPRACAASECCYSEVTQRR